MQSDWQELQEGSGCHLRVKCERDEFMGAPVMCEATLMKILRESKGYPDSYGS